ncbi:Beta-1,3-glucan-binding protein, N-terminal [Sergentomyia squamirostris]
MSTSDKVQEDKDTMEQENPQEEIKSEAENPEGAETNEFAYIQQGFTSEIFKIEVRNMPKHYGMGELRKHLQKNSLDVAKIKLPRQNSPWIYICFRSTEARDEGIRALNGMKWKGNVLEASEAKPAPDPLVKRRNEDAEQGGNPAKKARTIQECTTPLAHLTYEDQLKQKQSEAENLLKRFSGDIWKACPGQRVEIERLRKEFNGLPCEMEQIRASPLISGYRNKCEFTVGKDTSGQNVVGFRLGSYVTGFIEVSPVDELKHIPDRVKMAVRLFQQFVRASKHDVFNPEHHTGVFKQFSTRLSFSSNEIMLIVGVNGGNLSPGEAEQLKRDVREFFTEKDGKIVNVSSLFYQDMRKKDKDFKKDILEHLHGNTHITDEIHGLKFRISPEAFFQINTPGADVLYRSIIDLGRVTKDTTVLDICCGAGTIGLCCANFCKRVLGVEIIEQAVKDAKFNAEANSIENCEFFTGNTDDFIFTLMNRPGVSDGDVLAVVDPPRAGVRVKTLHQLRNARNLNRLIYVSCDPKRVFKNWLDLMRPCSKTMKGYPFKLKKAIPVDMFPHTPHMELILLFERDIPAEADAADQANAEDQQKSKESEESDTK